MSSDHGSSVSAGNEGRPILTYHGDMPARGSDKLAGWKSKMPWALLVVVGAPTAIAAFYFLLLASPIYVSEAKFIVRTQSQDSPSSLGVALQRVGLAASSSDAFAVHEYIKSRDAVQDVSKRADLRGILAEPVDPLSRFPRPWEGQTNEDLYKAFNRFITVGYDSTNGISTLRVEAFKPNDAHRIADALLSGGERLVNDLNERSSRNSVLDAEASLADAETRLQQAQSQLTKFRTSAEFIDPTRTATESSQLIGSLMASLAALQAERAQLIEAAPQSPQLPALDGRIRAYEGQILQQRRRLAGDADSLAPKIGAYEDLVLNREIADRSVVAARTNLSQAEVRARQQSLYLDRIVSPSLPDKAALPNRWLSVLVVFLTSLLVYGIGALVWAGIREHRQD